MIITVGPVYPDPKVLEHTVYCMALVSTQAYKNRPTQLDSYSC